MSLVVSCEAPRRAVPCSISKAVTHLPERWLPNPPPYPPSPPLDWPAFEPPPPAPGTPGPTEPPEPSGMPLAVVVIGVAFLAALATFALLLLLRPPKKRVLAASPTSQPGTTTPVPSTSGPGTTTPAPATVLTQAQLDKALPSLEAFVEAHRQLRYRTTPKVVVDQPSAYLAGWHTYLDRSAPLLRHLDVVLTSFGLNPSNADLVHAQRVWLGDQTVAFYDPATKVLHVRAVPFTAFVGEQVVAMLTRTLDDQWFAIGRLDPNRTLGDEQYALSALVSGDQQRISGLWLTTRSYSEQQDAVNEGADRMPNVSDPEVVPVALARWLSTPDTAGPDLVQAILQKGGRAALDAAFRVPPSGSQEANAWRLFLAGHKALPLPMPAPGGTVVADGRLGQFLLQEALTDHVDSDLLSQAMDGYAGDHTVAWEGSGRACSRIAIASADRAGAALMAQAVSQWAEKVGASTITVDDASRPGVPIVEATVCHAGHGNGGTKTTTTPTGPGPTDSGTGGGPNI